MAFGLFATDSSPELEFEALELDSDSESEYEPDESEEVSLFPFRFRCPNFFLLLSGNLCVGAVLLALLYKQNYKLQLQYR